MQRRLVQKIKNSILLKCNETMQIFATRLEAVIESILERISDTHYAKLTGQRTANKQLESDLLRLAYSRAPSMQDASLVEEGCTLIEYGKIPITRLLRHLYKTELDEPLLCNKTMCDIRSQLADYFTAEKQYAVILCCPRHQTKLRSISAVSIVTSIAYRVIDEGVDYIVYANYVKDNSIKRHYAQQVQTIDMDLEGTEPENPDEASTLYYRIAAYRKLSNDARNLRDLRRIEIDGDGHCVFIAITRALMGEEISPENEMFTVSVLRQMVAARALEGGKVGEFDVQEWIQTRYHYTSLLEYSKAVANMTRPVQWADEIEFALLADLLKIPIVTVTLLGGVRQQGARFGDFPRRPIYLLTTFGENHKIHSDLLV